MAKTGCLAACLALVLAHRALSAPQTEEPEGPDSAAAIMARVAANQDRAEALRARYLYVQHARVASRKGKRILCEEITDSRVAPSATGSSRQLLQLDGRALEKGRYVNFHSLREENGKAEGGKTDGNDVDCSLVEHMRANLLHERSRDGVNAHLFPLTSKEQAQYRFQWMGREHTQGREVFHIEFRPKDKEDYAWKGDAYIDTAAYQPVVVSTALSRKVPFAVRTLLGINVPGLGFTVTYVPVEDGVWFPASFGTEFQIEVLFFFRRTITMNAENRDFEKTTVTSHMLDAGETEKPPAKQ